MDFQASSHKKRWIFTPEQLEKCRKRANLGLPPASQGVRETFSIDSLFLNLALQSSILAFSEGYSDPNDIFTLLRWTSMSLLFKWTLKKVL